MTEVVCFSSCQFSQKGLCCKEKIQFSCDGCESYEVYPSENDPEYQNEYWIASRVFIGKGMAVVRQKRKGKRIELNGLVFFTEDDLRYGYEGVTLTEETTGYYIRGDELVINDPVKGQTFNEANFERLKLEIKGKPNVMDLPMEEIDMGR